MRFRRLSTQATLVRPLRPGEHEQEDGVVGRPVEQVVEEVDHSGVGPLQVLDDHHDRQVFGEALEEQTPAREQLLTCEGLHAREPEQLGQAGKMNSRSDTSGIQRSRPEVSFSATTSSGSSSPICKRPRTISESAQ